MERSDPESDFSWACGSTRRSAAEPGGCEAVQAAAGQTLMFALTFLSSAFVPVATMPGWLQIIAHANPVTYAVDALRALLVGGLTAGPVLLAMAWIAGLVAVFAPLAVHRCRRG